MCLLCKWCWFGLKPWLGQWLGSTDAKATRLGWISPVATSSTISLRPAVILPLGKGAVQAVLVRKPSFNWMSFTTNLAELHDKSTPPRINGWNPKIGGLGRCFSFSVLRYFQVPCWCFIGCRSFELTHPFKRMYGELPQHTLWFLGSYIICNIMSMICISYVNIYI